MVLIQEWLPGNVLDDPAIDFAGLAKSLGGWSSGPISDPNELRATLTSRH